MGLEGIDAEDRFFRRGFFVLCEEDQCMAPAYTVREHLGTVPKVTPTDVPAALHVASGGRGISSAHAANRTVPSQNYGNDLRCRCLQSHPLHKLTPQLRDACSHILPVRQWVLALPIPLRLLMTAQPKRVTPVLQVVHRVITRHLLRPAGLKADEADSGAVTLVRRFGSAANLNIHLHCLVLDGVYRCGADGLPVFVEAAAPTSSRGRGTRIRHRYGSRSTTSRL